MKKAVVTLAVLATLMSASVSAYDDWRSERYEWRNERDEWRSERRDEWRNERREWRNRRHPEEGRMDSLYIDDEDIDNGSGRRDLSQFWGRIPRPDDGSECNITDPAGFWDALSRVAGSKDVKNLPCVSTSLFARIGPQDVNDTVTNLGSREENFVTNYLGLQAWLQLSALYGKGGCEDTLKFLTGMKTLAGFAIPTKKDAFIKTGGLELGNVLVFKIPESLKPKADPEVPTTAFWFKFFVDEGRSNIKDGAVPMDVQREVNYAYTTADPEDDLNFLQVYKKLTGCKLPRKLQRAWGADYFPTSLFGQLPVPGFSSDDDRAYLVESGCKTSYVDAITNASAALANCRNVKCSFVEKVTDCLNKGLFERVSYEDRDAASVRAVMDICLSSSALNSGNGMTWDTVSSPFSCKRLSRQSSKDRQFAPEIVLPEIEDIVRSGDGVEKTISFANSANIFGKETTPACFDKGATLEQQDIDFITEGYKPHYCAN
ncbi:hypothetical protein HOP50_18g82650 [Chloropicon primus]|uniref:Plant heme peroxidase family profile domain-containing protein n=1 Tax=Chloropicon primus TaxID=1764295 RepID=A0A5B8N1X9_9CHLO|nr:hypothetical protein A3770_18p82420 [Chloropicon primus]UPR04920.1 hypothetical protein HOP50_18g82650 [Chloropicon primus]|mmetsp:Transcript_9189/g.26129  ORF Transcript_9189/g.26129 Transcript_9189/m.26129 type:complete len:488 (+) Transcript_9189:1-1464(+)|eukprot:QDZ25724.1 hypothetical protein A3770_18p82420 [Chloropicon primus]